mmetsp:Transcript_65640/g.150432  ORF Transcript_65640/g.150432 Transcript_65640/m.150432 type:complete len:582 (+) Transcript_65640:33-1778(+)
MAASVAHAIEDLSETQGLEVSELPGVPTDAQDSRFLFDDDDEDWVIPEPYTPRQRRERRGVPPLDCEDVPGPADPPELPDEWEEHVSNGHTFYYHPFRGQSVWDHPGAPPIARNFVRKWYNAPASQSSQSDAEDQVSGDAEGKFAVRSEQENESAEQPLLPPPPRTPLDGGAWGDGDVGLAALESWVMWALTIVTAFRQLATSKVIYSLPLFRPVVEEWAREIWETWAEPLADEEENRATRSAARELRWQQSRFARRCLELSSAKQRAVAAARARQARKIEEIKRRHARRRDQEAALKQDLARLTLQAKISAMKDELGLTIQACDGQVAECESLDEEELASAGEPIPDPPPLETYVLEWLHPVHAVSEQGELHTLHNIEWQMVDKSRGKAVASHLMLSFRGFRFAGWSHSGPPAVAIGTLDTGGQFSMLLREESGVETGVSGTLEVLEETVRVKGKIVDARLEPVGVVSLFAKTPDAEEASATGPSPFLATCAALLEGPCVHVVPEFATARTRGSRRANIFVGGASDGVEGRPTASGLFRMPSFNSLGVPGLSSLPGFPSLGSLFSMRKKVFEKVGLSRLG